MKLKTVHYEGITGGRAADKIRERPQKKTDDRGEKT